MSMDTPIRAVIDTNIFVSGLFYGGKPRTILDGIASGIIIPCFIETTYQELERVLLSDRFVKARQALGFSVDDYLDWLRGASLLLPRPKVANVIKEDPADNELLACALAAEASFIISGDTHLTNLQEFHGISIVKPQQFIKRISGKR